MKFFLHSLLIILAILAIENSDVCSQTIWHPTGGPLGGTVSDIAIDSVGRIWVCNRSGGVLVSADNGSSWKLVNAGFQKFNTLHITASKNGYIYVTSLNRALLYRLNTNNPTWVWEEITPTTSGGDLVASVIVGHNNEVFVAFGARGILHSLDNGSTWLPYSEGIVDKTPFLSKVSLIASGKPNEFCAVYDNVYNSHHLWTTVDNGQHWTLLPKAIPDSTDASALVIAADGSILVGIKAQDSKTPLFGGRIYRWDGTNWTKVFERPFTSEDGKNHLDAMSLVRSTATLYANAHGYSIRSIDNGVTWAVTDSEKRGDETFQIASTPDESGLYQMCEEDGVFYSADHGKTWVEKNSGILQQLMYGLAINSKQELFAVTEFGLTRSTNHGNGWEVATEYHETYQPNIFIDANDRIFIGTTDGLFRSTDNGNTLSEVIPGFDSSQLPTKTFNSVLMVRQTSSGKLFSVGTYSKWNVESSTDGGIKWQIVTSLPNTTMTAIACSHDTVIAAGNSNEFYRSVNDGVTWTMTSNTFPSGIKKLIINTDGAYLAYSQGTAGGAWLSQDAGVSWNKIFPTAELNATDFFGIDVDGLGNVYLCTDSGILATSNKSYAAWKNVSSGINVDPTLPNRFMNVSQVVRDPKSNKYYAATRGLSVYESVPFMNGVRYSGGFPSSASTIVNYPNPFTTSTMINFRIDQTASVALELYNSIGQRMMQIMNSKLEAGEHTIPFESGTLPSGTYMLVLRGGSSTQSSWITITK